jgi:hypothetical protein
MWSTILTSRLATLCYGHRADVVPALDTLGWDHVRADDGLGALYDALSVEEEINRSHD